VAFSFLTILPTPSRGLPSPGPTDLARSFAAFPLVGIVLGGIIVLPAWLCPSLGSPFLHAALIAGLLCLLTRALHLDGLADVSDGFGGGHTPERRLEIMKDSRTGAFGVAAVVFLVLIKASALEVLVARNAWSAICLGPVLGRFAMVAAAYRNRYARKEGGLGQSFVEHISFVQVLAASILTSLPCAFLAPLSSLYALAAVLCLVGLARFASHRMIGGLTGDVLGAINETSEALSWLVFALLPHVR
jgi:adenosylcobinamide-GDP ribazoletransferase